MQTNITNFQDAQVFFKLAKLNSKSQNIRRIKSDRTLKRKEQLKINNDESIQFYCSIVVIMVRERTKTVL